MSKLTLRQAVDVAILDLETFESLNPTLKSTGLIFLREALAEQPAQGEAVVRATVIKRGADRTWMSERMGELPDGTYSLYTAQPAPPLPDAVARKVAIAEWVAQNSWWTYSAANEAVTKAERLAAAPEPNRG